MLIAIQQSEEGITKWNEAVFSSKTGPEFELQEVIEKNPDLIPWKILGLSSPLKVLGREVATVDGKMIDHLAIDSQGHVYIFECKMAKNNELRSVIAQALEYAAQLSSSLTTLDELLTAVKKTPQEVVEVFEDTEDSQVTQGLERAVRKADYRIIIVTDYAGNSSQARVNRKTIEYLRSTLEIHLVEIAKFENQLNEKLFVPHITAGGAAIARTSRQLEVWEKNLFNSLSGNPALSAALMEYLSWVKDTNPEGTRVTPGGTLTSSIPNVRYIAYIETLDKGSSYRIWVQTTLPEGLSETKLTEWKSTLDSYSEKLGEPAGRNYYLLKAETEPHVIESHLELQRKLLELAQSAESNDGTPDAEL